MYNSCNVILIPNVQFLLALAVPLKLEFGLGWCHFYMDAGCDKVPAVMMVYLRHVNRAMQF